MQVLVVPQVPSVEMGLEAVEVEEVFEEVVVLAFVDEVVVLEVQLPDAGWHPVPQ